MNKELKENKKLKLKQKNKLNPLNDKNNSKLETLQINPKEEFNLPKELKDKNKTNTETENSLLKQKYQKIKQDLQLKREEEQRKRIKDKDLYKILNDLYEQEHKLQITLLTTELRLRQIEEDISDVEKYENSIL